MIKFARFVLLLVPILIVLALAWPFFQQTVANRHPLLAPSPMRPVDHDLPDDYRPFHGGRIYPGNGLYIRRNEDLVLRGTPPPILRRTYHSLDSRNRAFGIGASHGFESFVIGDSTRFQWWL